MIPVSPAEVNFPATDGVIPATYEVVYGAAWGSAGKRAASAVDGEVHIAPNSIRRRDEREPKS